MKKVVFCNIMMMKKVDKFIYPLDGKVLYDKEIAFPINSILAGELKENDEVLVVLLKKNDIEGNSDHNVGMFMAELNAINNTVGAKIEYKIISSDYDESKETQETQLRAMIDVLSDGDEVYCDMTYGPKALPIILFAVLNFGEKHFGIDLKQLVYGKVDFVGGKPCNPALIDMTPLYYLNSVTNSIECRSGKEAKEMLDAVLSM